MRSKKGMHRNRGGSGSRLPVAIVIFVSIFVPLVFFVGRGIYATTATTATTSYDQENIAANSMKQELDWREKLALQNVKSLFSREVIDVIKANTNDLDPLSLDSFRKNNLSASWKFVRQEIPVDKISSLTEAEAAKIVQETPKGKDAAQVEFVDTPAKLARRQLREKKREKRAAELVKQDDEVTMKLENDAFERSKSIDSVVLGIATMKNQTNLARKLQNRVKESQHALQDGSSDSDLSPSAAEKIKDMGQVLSKAKDPLPVHVPNYRILPPFTTEARIP